MNADKRLVLVLGMHRSGTSALTKGLQVLGVDLGSNFNPATADNPTGFWEDKDFHSLNEAMLKHLDRSWDDLQLVEGDAVLSRLEDFLPQARALLDEFLRDKTTAGLKDPRFSLLLPFWKKVFAEAELPVSYIIGFRNPLSVAKSLSRRDAFPKTKALWLWALHHIFITAGTANVSRFAVDYDRMLEDPHGQLDRLAHFLGATPQATSMEEFCSEFLQPDLRHARYSAADLRKDPDCAPIIWEIYEHFAAESSNTQSTDAVSWEQVASRWEHSLRPFKGLLNLSSILGQEVTVLKTKAVHRALEFHEQFKTLEGHSSNIAQENAKLLQEAETLAHENTALKQESTELSCKIQGIETSRSWKITAPLRYLEKKLKITELPPNVSTPSRLPSWLIAILFGLLCFVVYNANFRVIGAGDTFPARYLPLNLWKYGTFNFEANVRLVAHGHPMTMERTRPPGADAKVSYFEPFSYWLVRTRQHQLASLYPIVTPLLVAPLYLPAVTWLNAHGWEQSQMDWVAELMEKLSASFLAAIACVFMYLVLRRDCGRWGLLLALVFAFGTNTWVTSSQALWQHAVGELLVAVALLLLTAPASAARLTLLGSVCILMAANRPPDLLIAGAIALFAIWRDKRKAVWLLAGGAIPLVALLCYNLEFIGHIVGGYALAKNANKKFFQLDWTGLPGLLVSPSRGLLIFSPFLIFLPVGLALRLREVSTRGLAVALSFAAVAQFLLYSQADWRAGVSWGPRWLADLLPILVWMLAPTLLVLRPLARSLLLTLMAASIAIQAIGAFWYTKTSDDLILAYDLHSTKGAWNFGNTPYLSELRHSRAPFELLQGTAGSIDRVGSKLNPRAEDIPQLENGAAVEGWTLVGLRAPAQMFLLVDGIVIGSTQTFSPREDVNQVWPGASSSGWSLPANTTGVATGRQVLQLAVRIGPRSDLRIVREQPVFIVPQAIPIESTALTQKLAASAELDAMARGATALLRARQSPEGYWLTDYTSGLAFKEPEKEMNTFLTSMLVDLLSPIAQRENLNEVVERARQHLTTQIERNGLVRYHGLPNGRTIGKLGCVITPDADNTALAWRISGLGSSDSRMKEMLATLGHYRDARGFYRTWLAPKSDYQNLNPGHDPNPTDIGIQLHVYLMLRKLDAPAAEALGQALQRFWGDEDIWTYYAKAPLIPYLRAAQVQQLGLDLPPPADRLALPAKGQEIWSEVAHQIVTTTHSSKDPIERDAINEVLGRIGRDNFALLRKSPPLLYHNDISASVKRFYWSEDFGYALWLRLYDEARMEPGQPRLPSH